MVSLIEECVRLSQYTTEDLRTKLATPEIVISIRDLFANGNEDTRRVTIDVLNKLVEYGRFHGQTEVVSH
jgi:hypothetical protein